MFFINTSARKNNALFGCRGVIDCFQAAYFMKGLIMETQKKLATARVVLPFAALAGTTTAMAAVPADVKTSLQNSQTDGLEVGWLVVAAIAAIFVIGLVKRLLH